MAATKRKYAGSTSDFEKKLARVMDRLGVKQYSYDWNQGRTGSSCYVEMRYGASAYRFENTTAKSADCGRNLVYVSDLFAAIVYSLEGLARAVEQGIFTLDMLLTGVPSLPAADPLEDFFVTLGFHERPETVEEVQSAYRRLCMTKHPDVGGSVEEFREVVKARDQALEYLGRDGGPV